MEFRSRGRKKTGMSFYMALGLCIAAACLVGLSAMINRHDSAADKDAELTEWASEQSIEQSAESVYEPVGAEPEQAFSAEVNENGSVGELSETEEQEADTMPYRQLPEETGEEEQPESAAAVDVNSVNDEDEAVYADAPLMTDVADTVISSSAKLALPVQGKIIKPFSGTELVFCSTLGDWRVHQGMDIAADPGSIVHAAAPGSVVDFVEDPLFGYTAVVENGETMLYYCGLSSTCMVSPGMSVNTGDVIGYVGDVPCEAGDGSHIHLAMIKDGEFTDPSQYINP